MLLQLVIQKFKGLSEVIKDNFRHANYLDVTHEKRDNLDGLKTPKGIGHQFKERPQHPMTSFWNSNRHLRSK